MENDLNILRDLERKVRWLASWMIHNANQLRDTGDGLKVGGHQASSASLTTILTALYFDVLKPEDRVAVKATPLRTSTPSSISSATRREKLEAFRGYKGAQSYPSRTKDTDDVDFSTGSSVSAWRKRCSRHWCRITSARMAGRHSGAKGE